MAKESIEERMARLAPGARWLCAQRERRGWSGRELARRAGVGQDRISAYENAQDRPSEAFARKLAEVLGLPETEVWRGLQLPLPADYPTPQRTNEELLAEVLRRDAADGQFRRALRNQLRSQGASGATRPVAKDNPVTPPGDSEVKPSQPEDPAV
jgi:transcriptional regulator with XRE-family HTH domain